MRNHFVFDPEFGVTLIKPNGDGSYTVHFTRNGKARERTFMMVNPGKDFESFELKAGAHIRSLKG